MDGVGVGICGGSGMFPPLFQIRTSAIQQARRCGSDGLSGLHTQDRIRDRRCASDSVVLPFTYVVEGVTGCGVHSSQTVKGGVV